MNKGILLLAVGLLLNGCVQNSTLPQSNNPTLQNAIMDGKILFKAYNEQRGKEVNKPVVLEARGKISDFCGFDYQPVVVEKSGEVMVYFIGDTKNQGEIVFGKHYKVVGDEVIPSTKTCYILPPPPPGVNATAAYTSHLLSAFPTEFHVFLSLKYRKAIYVQCSSGVWCVDGAKITQVE
ncbi:MAG: hypothetical protein JW709_13055 [Sedimentisphaerales bacterium]|nr:hypothetical protein [Sedimentisphaerales bacterium]